MVSGEGGAKQFLIRKPKQFLVFHNEMGLEKIKKITDREEYGKLPLNL